MIGASLSVWLKQNWFIVEGNNKKVSAICANYKPITKDQVHLLDLIESTFEYKIDVYLV